MLALLNFFEFQRVTNLKVCSLGLEVGLLRFYSACSFGLAQGTVLFLRGKFLSPRMTPLPSGFQIILPSGLLAFPAMLPACHFRCVLPAQVSLQVRLRILTTAQ